MCIPESYNDNTEQSRTCPMSLTKPDKAGVVPKKDLEVLAKAMGVDGPGKKQPSRSTPQLTNTKVRRRSVLNGKRYGTRNRPYREIKEGQEKSW